MSLEVDGDLRDWLAEIDALRPERLTLALNQAWAKNAAERLREYVGGGPVTRYLTFRSGAARESVQASADRQGGTLSASGPGLPYLEDGGIIRPKKGLWLTFRLHEPWDGAEPTGRWVRARQVKIPARHMVRDAAEQALDALDLEFSRIIGGEAA